MTRDWRKVALAALAAVALGAVCSLDAHAQAPKPGAKSAKAPASSAKAPASEAKSEAAEADDTEDAQAKDAKASAKKKRQDPVEAQRAIEGAAKLVQTGKVDQAVQSLSAVLAGGNLPPAI